MAYSQHFGLSILGF